MRDLTWFSFIPQLTCTIFRNFIDIGQQCVLWVNSSVTWKMTNKFARLVLWRVTVLTTIYFAPSMSKILTEEAGCKPVRCCWYYWVVTRRPRFVSACCTGINSPDTIKIMTNRVTKTSIQRKLSACPFVLLLLQQLQAVLSATSVIALIVSGSM